MKSAVLALALTLPSMAYASEFFCFEDSTQEWVHVVTESADASFAFGRADEEILRFNLPNDAILSSFPILSISTLLVQNESIIHVSGDIEGSSGSFSILRHRNGIGNERLTFSQNYRCRELPTRADQ